MSKKKKPPELVAIIHKDGARAVGKMVDENEFTIKFIPTGSDAVIDLWKNHITVLRVLRG